MLEGQTTIGRNHGKVPKQRTYVRQPQGILGPRICTKWCNNAGCNVSHVCDVYVWNMVTIVTHWWWRVCVRRGNHGNALCFRRWWRVCEGWGNHGNALYFRRWWLVFGVGKPWYFRRWLRACGGGITMVALCVSDVYVWGGVTMITLCVLDAGYVHVGSGITMVGLCVSDVYVWGGVTMITLCVSDAGDVYVWGYGIIGKGPNVDSSEFPTRIPPTLFGRNEFNTETKVKDIQAGLSHFMAVNSTCTHTHTHSHSHSNPIDLTWA